MSNLTLALIQTPTFWHDPAANRDHFEALLTALPEDTQVAVLPEMFSTGFTMASREVAESMDGETVSWLRQLSSRLGKVICGSVVVRAGDEYHNRFLWVAPDGRVEHYDKRHLFRMAGEHEHYDPGTDRLVCEIDGWRICPLVCYDLRFPVWFRNRTDETGRYDYDVFLCVANWPLARRDAWLSLLKARAIENQAYAVGVNIVGTDGAGVTYGGGTAVFTAEGVSLAQALDEAAVVNVTLERNSLIELRRAFPVWQDADDFSLS